MTPPIGDTPLPETATVLGAGVMGRQIAALLATAGVEVHLLDLAAEGDPAGRAREAIASLSSMRPAPLLDAADADRIHPGALDVPEAALAASGWIIEAVVEDLAIKRQILDRVEASAPEGALISTNTSGLAIRQLVEGRAPCFAERFVGVHFFNPPRAMPLVELISGAATTAATLATARSWVESGLGKRVVICRDTPNFIANRLGVFALMDALHRMERSGLGVDEVDAVTGPLLGRPRSATLRLADLVGLDTLAHVATTAHEGLPGDAWRDTFRIPLGLQSLLDEGHLGAKTGSGYYARKDGEILSRDPKTGQYVPRTRVDTSLPTRGPLAGRLDALWASQDALSRFAREHLAASIAYAVACAGEVADHPEDVDRALRWGFNWEAGPLELADTVGAARLVDTLQAAGDPVPEGLQRLVAESGTIYRQVDGSSQILGSDGVYVSIAPEPRVDDATWMGALPVVTQTEVACLMDAGDGIGVLRFQAGALNVLGEPALEQMTQAATDSRWRGLVLCGRGDHFSAGADLAFLLRLIDAGDWQALETYLERFQAATGLCRTADRPIVVAARGLALGGGCEFVLSCPRPVLGSELTIGLVESRVGLIPGAGGCRELLRRFGADVEQVLDRVLTGSMSDNARQAQGWGLVRADTPVRLDGHRIAQHGVEGAREALDTWAPASSQMLQTPGAAGIERIETRLHGDLEAGKASEHDVTVGSAVARVLCGGGESSATETRILELEREQFARLCGMPLTRARIEHMLATGKPLRN